MKKAPLISQKCGVCEGGTPRLKPSDIKECLRAVKGWKVKGGKIVKSFGFKNYRETTVFVNGVVRIAQQEDHHPDITFGYKKCDVFYSTHAVKGLTLNDFICAAKIDALLEGNAK